MSDTWTIVNTRFDAHSLGQHNSVFTIANGYLGIKGNLCEDRDGYSPVTLINGVYDELDMFSQIRASNEERRYLDARHFDTAGRSPAVANLPNPLHVRVFVGDREISLTRGTITEFQQELSLRDGVYRYRFVHADGDGRQTRIEMARFASLRHCHRVYMRYTVTPINHDCDVWIVSGISGQTVSNTTRERQYAVTALEADARAQCRLWAKTPARGIEVELAVEHALARPMAASSGRGVVEHSAVSTTFTLEGRPGQAIQLDRYVALRCSEDARHGQLVSLEGELDAANDQGFDQALADQRAEWDALWRRCDVQIEGDDAAQRHLRFCLYHLLASAPRCTDRLSVPVKLLSGEYYQGNTFYDTDVYILPFYTFTQPEFARTCLNWRHVGLEPGRMIAQELGHRGAKFAWQAGPYGEECLGKWWRFTHTNIHVNSDAAYALMQYWLATGDDVFMNAQGVDLLVETARFLASRSKHDAADGTYSLVDVAGPDEGHCESTDNFYTNYLAKWNLKWAADAVERLRTSASSAYEAAVKRLSIAADEPAHWREVSDGLRLFFDPASKIYEQYDGFYKLTPLAPELTRDRKVWFATVAPYQALNQPDVLMAMAMFRDAFPADVLRANYDYYYAKSMNFSSMSFVINSIMSAQVGEMKEAYEQFIISAGHDIDEELTGRKDTFAGLHGTAMGGAWMAAVLGFGGVRLTEDGLAIQPTLPSQWQSLSFTLQYRGAELKVRVTPQEVHVHASDNAPSPVTIRIGETPHTLAPSESVIQAYASGPSATAR